MFSACLLLHVGVTTDTGQYMPKTDSFYSDPMGSILGHDSICHFLDIGSCTFSHGPHSDPMGFILGHDNICKFLDIGSQCFSFTFLQGPYSDPMGSILGLKKIGSFLGIGSLWGLRKFFPVCE